MTVGCDTQSRSRKGFLRVWTTAIRSYWLKGEAQGGGTRDAFTRRIDSSLSFAERDFAGFRVVIQVKR